MSPEFPLQALEAPLSATERGALVRALCGLLDWQRSLLAWPSVEAVPEATPIVSLYAHGVLNGCAGMGEGSARERLCRAFVAALGDGRFGGLDAAGRAALVAQVSFPIAPRRVDPESVSAELELGVHGISLVRADGSPFTLLPDVARDHRLGPEEFLSALERKSDTARAKWPQDGLFLFETERVVARGGEAFEPAADAATRAVRWLRARIGRAGAVQFGLEPHSGGSSEAGPMAHGRAAITVRALDAHPEGQAAAARARRFLAREIENALLGQPVAEWPEEPALVAGTLALACLAGIDVRARLERVAADPALLAVPWHAAQVVAALGAGAPEALWQSVLLGLESEAWNPWTLLAAQQRGNELAVGRATELLIASVRDKAPYLGGVGPAPVPELGRTAATVEALKLVSNAEAKSAVSRALSFIERHQLRAETYPVAQEAAWADGAFPVSPISDFLQSDITGHALLALSA